jgi:hypothetical protein
MKKPEDLSDNFDSKNRVKVQNQLLKKARERFVFEIVESFG